MAQKTYILPSTFDHPPTSITLGSLLADPFNPHRTLATFPASKPSTTTTTRTNLFITRSSTSKTSLSLSTRLLELAGLKLASELSLSQTITYAAASVTVTSYEPPLDEIHSLILATPRAKRILFGSVLGGKLFLITGVQTAVGFTVSAESSTKRGGSLGADVPLASAVPGWEVGGGLAGSRERREGETYTVEGEVVIAYRVLVVKKRGWRAELSLADYRARDTSRMLGDGDDDEKKAGEDVSVGTLVFDSEEGEAVVFSM
ncbi:hypothetical protein B0T16DRAFT_353866 [Cercophora newfieldiana]|uniref:Uncharacterized protein n=1 Tax=Cercophora newfieldiana TaxID=92897 RepID=A0AA40CQ62_9PEZI|nr:hypothetical protein B0T16DRAFT_353866 [Cercophora newfieldiana]